MRHHIIGLKVLIAFTVCGVMQSCYVQKGSEVHATVIYDQYPEDNVFAESQYVDMVTVEENLSPSSSLEALSTSLLLIDLESKKKVTRWEDNLSYNYKAESETSRWSEESESLTPTIINN